MSGRKFYDIHCHAFNLSHPAFLPFIKRLGLDRYLFLNSIPLVNVFVTWMAGDRLKSIEKLLSVIENDLGDYFLLLESGDVLPLLEDGCLKMGGYTYEKMVLTPLMMDFGIREVRRLPDIRTPISSHKRITEQVIDLFNGIKSYQEQSELHFFEIFPFLGLNTQGYAMQKTRANQANLPELLDKYFSAFTAENMPHRPQLLRQQMGCFSGDIDDLGNYAFAGIKLYPPLGFDPWPAETLEREKVIYLYDYCTRRQIPITTHCSDGVFMANKDAKTATAPERWLPVLQYENGRFANLRLNFAHLGHQSSFLHGYQWQKTIIQLMAEYPNIYSDFSYRGVDPLFYRSLNELLRHYPFIRERILFGSDFMINLLDCDCYYTYLKNFINSGALNDEQKDMFASRTPERFLFDL